MRFLQPTYENIISCYNAGKNNVLIVVNNYSMMMHIIGEIRYRLEPNVITRDQPTARIITLNSRCNIKFTWEERHFHGLTPDAILSLEDYLLPQHIIYERNTRAAMMERAEEVQFRGGRYYTVREQRLFDYSYRDTMIEEAIRHRTQQELQNQWEENSFIDSAAEVIANREPSLERTTYTTGQPESINREELLQNIQEAHDRIAPSLDTPIPYAPLELNINGERHTPTFIGGNGMTYFNVGNECPRVVVQMKPQWNTKCLLCGADAYIDKGPIECSKKCYSKENKNE